MTSFLAKRKKPPRASERFGCPGWLFPKSCSFVWALTRAYTALSSWGGVRARWSGHVGHTGRDRGLSGGVLLRGVLSVRFVQCLRDQVQHEVSLGELFVELILDLSDYRSIKSSNRQMLIQNVISYISENYQENISLNDAAKKVFLSPSYLSTLVTSETGKSFTDILNETRIQKAIQLLKDPTRKIAEIAYEVGFREPQYFTIAFKKYTELTPRDYRELYLKG